MNLNTTIHEIDKGIERAERYGKKLDSDRMTIRSGIFMLGEVARVTVDGTSLKKG